MATAPEEQQRKFRIARATGQRGWTNQEYTLEQIMRRARRDNRYVVDGYGRQRVRAARKLQAVDRLRKRPTIVFAEIEQEEKAPSSFGPRTPGV